MENKKQISVIGERIGNVKVPAEAMLSLTEEVGKMFTEGVSEKENFLKFF